MARTVFTGFNNEMFSADRVVRIERTHRLGRPARAVVEVEAAVYAGIQELVGTLAEVLHGHDGEPPSCFAGVVEAATVRGRLRNTGTASALTYQFHLVSQMALLERSVGCQIFQEQDVQQIVSAVLEQNAIAADRFEWRLAGSYPVREYCVQYRESALAFVSRLLEEEGIYYFSECAPGEGEKIIFADDSTAAAAIEDPSTVPFRIRTGRETDDSIHKLSEHQRVRTGKFVLRDFDFKHPSLDLTCEAEAEERPDLQVYDYPGLYFEKGEGDRLVATRLEEEQAERLTFRIESDCTRIAAGRKLTIEDHEEHDGDYFVTEVTHEFEDGEGDAASRYELKAKLLALDVKFRPDRVTPRPVVEGPQTARVVAPEGSEPEEIHTDEHGRCKVKFHWDNAEAVDDKASCWMRVAQLQTSGSMVLPRIDWEVIVEFLEGDPDRPIVTGRLFNGTFMPPYALPGGASRTSLQTASTPGGGGSNEIRFEDKEGAEEIMIRSQHNTEMKAANNKTKNVGNNDSSVVSGNNSLDVSGDQDQKVSKGNENTVTGDQTVSVGGNRKQEINAVYGLEAGGSATITVGGNQFEMDGNPLEGLLAVAAERAAEYAAAQAEQVLGSVEAAVNGAVDQVLGPVEALTGQIDDMVGTVGALASGDLSAAGPLVAQATGVPAAGAVVSSLGGGGGGPAATNAAGAGGMSAAEISGVNALRAGATEMIQRGMGGARDAVSGAINNARDAATGGGGGGGGSSMDNVAGPDGEAAGADEGKDTKGPGHSHYKIAANHTETSASLRLMAALNGINTNVTASMTQTVGAAHVELILGDRAESVEGMKTENEIALIVVTKGDESENTGGAKTMMVGGAVIQLVKGSYEVEAGAPATFIGAFQKMQAKGKITFKCGASEVVIDGGGITIESPMVMNTTAKYQMTKNVSDGGG